MLPAFACAAQLDSGICALFNFKEMVDNYYGIRNAVDNNCLQEARQFQRQVIQFNAQFAKGE